MRDRYEVGDLLGRGGMGQVHMARHRSGHLVAIKRVRDTLSNDLLVRDRLANEATLLRRVNHPNVIRALDAGQDTDGTPYLVMDKLNGRPLSEVISKGGPLPVQRVRAIAAQLLAGIAAIHAAGVVHADIKSSNVMIDDADQVRIIDFGLARTMSRFESNGMIAGTPSYMAPEVIAGADATSVSDIYAVGAILYEMLTGQRPFSGPMSAIILRQLHEAIEPPSKRRPDAGIGAELDAIVLRALARDPAARFATATELAAAIAGAELDDASELPDLLELTATRDFWGGMTLPRVARPVDTEQQAAETRPLDANVLIASALDRVRTLVEGKDLDAAIRDLETTLSVLRSPEDEVVSSVWRLESVLAALYDHCGRREAAARVARLAHQHALRGTAQGPKLRTREILDRISARAPRIARGSKLMKKAR